MYKQILVPVDLADTDLAKPAIATAVAMAKASGGSVRLVNVLPMTPVMLAEYVPPDFDVQQRKSSEEALAIIARECGLEPLAQALLADPTLDPQAEAAKFVNGKPTADGGVPDVKAALDGARDILSEQFGETAELLGKVRDHLWNQGLVSSTVVEGKETAEEGHGGGFQRRQKSASAFVFGDRPEDQPDHEGHDGKDRQEHQRGQRDDAFHQPAPICNS